MQLRSKPQRISMESEVESWFRILVWNALHFGKRGKVVKAAMGAKKKWGQEGEQQVTQNVSQRPGATRALGSMEVPFREAAVACDSSRLR
jgi:hypothetical protein